MPSKGTTLGNRQIVTVPWMLFVTLPLILFMAIHKEIAKLRNLLTTALINVLALCQPW